MLQDLREQMPHRALAALEQAAKDPTSDHTRAIAVCLAYLYCIKPCERWPFDDFWLWMDCDDEVMRSAILSRRINAISRQTGIGKN